MVVTTVVKGFVRESARPSVGIIVDVLVGGFRAIRLEDTQDVSVLAQHGEVPATPLANTDVGGRPTVASQLDNAAERTKAGHLGYGGNTDADAPVSGSWW